jgi:choline dehydrogenase
MPDAADFVVIGAGSAGCVLADGLSRDHTVVLLEAGGSDRRLEVSIPAAFYKLFKTERDWAYETTPEESANGRRLFLPRGRMLGGSSSMNAMIYIRGRPSDYDGWAAVGADGWGWASVQPIFKEMESNSRGASDDHGTAGSLRVEDLRAPSPFSQRFVQAAIEYGMEANPDFNGPRQDGAGFFQVTQRRGRRWSAADAYLRPAMGRPTLEVVTGATCSRIVLENGAAIGVEFTRDGRVERVDAGMEIILAAGAFGSPHLLQLSGVGDPGTLTNAGIEVRWPSPHVGRHLQDHPVAGVIQRSSAPGTLDDAESFGELARWLLFRTGRLTSNVAEAGAFARSDPGLSEPDLQFHFGPVYFEGHGLVPFDGHAFSLGPTLLTPHSEGTVAVVSPDPEVPPEITGNYLAEGLDVAALVKGVRMAREIISMPAFDDVRGEEILPGAEVTGPDDLETFVRDRFELLYHPVGTCRMGPEGSGVVDPALRVHGIDRLRVADASVMPRVIGGNTNAATMMIAARAVEMILAD